MVHLLTFFNLSVFHTDSRSSFSACFTRTHVLHSQRVLHGPAACERHGHHGSWRAFQPHHTAAVSHSKRHWHLPRVMHTAGAPLGIFFVSNLFFSSSHAHPRAHARTRDARLHTQMHALTHAHTRAKWSVLQFLIAHCDCFWYTSLYHVYNHTYHRCMFSFFLPCENLLLFLLLISFFCFVFSYIFTLHFFYLRTFTLMVYCFLLLR